MGGFFNKRTADIVTQFYYIIIFLSHLSSAVEESLISYQCNRYGLRKICSRPADLNYWGFENPCCYKYQSIIRELTCDNVLTCHGGLLFAGELGTYPYNDTTTYDITTYKTDYVTPHYWTTTPFNRLRNFNDKSSAMVTGIIFGAVLISLICVLAFILSARARRTHNRRRSRRRRELSQRLDSAPHAAPSYDTVMQISSNEAQGETTAWIESERPNEPTISSQQTFEPSVSHDLPEPPSYPDTIPPPSYYEVTGGIRNRDQ